jgi:hypothetical protein
MFRSFETIFRGSTVKETCLTIATDLSLISYTVVTMKRVKIVYF